MRKTIQRIRDLFTTEAIQGISADEIDAALSEAQTRGVWVQAVFGEIQRINLEIDRRLLDGVEWSLTDLSARRKAIQDVLELALSARREVKRGVRPNPVVDRQTIDLDRVTA